MRGGDEFNLQNELDDRNNRFNQLNNSGNQAPPLVGIDVPVVEYYQVIPVPSANPGLGNRPYSALQLGEGDNSNLLQLYYSEHYYSENAGRIFNEMHALGLLFDQIIRSRYYPVGFYLDSRGGLRFDQNYFDELNCRYGKYNINFNWPPLLIEVLDPNYYNESILSASNQQQLNAACSSRHFQIDLASNRVDQLIQTVSSSCNIDNNLLQSHLHKKNLVLIYARLGVNGVNRYTDNFTQLMRLNRDFCSEIFNSSSEINHALLAHEDFTRFVTIVSGMGESLRETVFEIIRQSDDNVHYWHGINESLSSLQRRDDDRYIEFSYYFVKRVDFESLSAAQSIQDFVDIYNQMGNFDRTYTEDSGISESHLTPFSEMQKKYLQECAVNPNRRFSIKSLIDKAGTLQNNIEKETFLRFATFDKNGADFIHQFSVFYRSVNFEFNVPFIRNFSVRDEVFDFVSKTNLTAPSVKLINAVFQIIWGDIENNKLKILRRFNEFLEKIEKYNNLLRKHKGHVTRGLELLSNDNASFIRDLGAMVDFSENLGSQIKQGLEQSFVFSLNGRWVFPATSQSSDNKFQRRLDFCRRHVTKQDELDLFVKMMLFATRSITIDESALDELFQVVGPRSIKQELVSYFQDHHSESFDIGVLAGFMREVDTSLGASVQKFPAVVQDVLTRVMSAAENAAALWDQLYTISAAENSASLAALLDIFEHHPDINRPAICKTIIDNAALQSFISFYNVVGYSEDIHTKLDSYLRLSRDISTDHPDMHQILMHVANVLPVNVIADFDSASSRRLIKQELLSFLVKDPSLEDLHELCSKHRSKFTLLKEWVDNPYQPVEAPVEKRFFKKFKNIFSKKPLALPPMIDAARKQAALAAATQEINAALEQDSAQLVPYQGLLTTLRRVIASQSIPNYLKFVLYTIQQNNANDICQELQTSVDRLAQIEPHHPLPLVLLRNAKDFSPLCAVNVLENSLTSEQNMQEVFTLDAEKLEMQAALLKTRVSIDKTDWSNAFAGYQQQREVDLLQALRDPDTSILNQVLIAGHLLHKTTGMSLNETQWLAIYTLYAQYQNNENNIAHLGEMGTGQGKSRVFAVLQFLLAAKQNAPVIYLTTSKTLAERQYMSFYRFFSILQDGENPLPIDLHLQHVRETPYVSFADYRAFLTNNTVEHDNVLLLVDEVDKYYALRGQSVYNIFASADEDRVYVASVLHQIIAPIANSITSIDHKLVNTCWQDPRFSSFQSSITKEELQQRLAGVVQAQRLKLHQHFSIRPVDLQNQFGRMQYGYSSVLINEKTGREDPALFSEVQFYLDVYLRCIQQNIITQPSIKDILTETAQVIIHQSSCDYDNPINASSRLPQPNIGMSATMPAECQTNNLVVFPPHQASNRVDHPPILFKGDDYLSPLLDRIEYESKKGNSVLLFVPSFEVGEKIKDKLILQYANVTSVYPRDLATHAQEEAVLCLLKNPGAVVISTGALARGVDTRGPITVIILETEAELLCYDDCQQMKGRAGRQEPGASISMIPTTTAAAKLPYEKIIFMAELIDPQRKGAPNLPSFQPYIYDKYDSSHCGKAVLYTSFLEMLKAWWYAGFAHLRAALCGDGIAFPYLQAWWHGYITLAQALFGLAFAQADNCSKSDSTNTPFLEKQEAQEPMPPEPVNKKLPIEETSLAESSQQPLLIISHKPPAASCRFKSEEQQDDGIGIFAT